MEIQRSMDEELTEHCGCSLTAQLKGALIGMWQSQSVPYVLCRLATMKIIIHHLKKTAMEELGSENRVLRNIRNMFTKLFSELFP